MYIHLEFDQSTDINEGFLKVKEAEANKQHKSIIGALRTLASTCVFEQFNFVVDNRRSVVQSDLYAKLKKLNIQGGKKYILFADRMTQVSEAHDQLILSILKQVQGLSRPDTDWSSDDIRHNVHL